MGFRTPDQFPGVTNQEGLILLDESVQPLTVGEFRLDGTDLFARDGVGVFNLRQGGGALPAPTGPGQQLMTDTTNTVRWLTPITSGFGWLANRHGELLVKEFDA